MEDDTFSFMGIYDKQKYLYHTIWMVWKDLVIKAYYR